MVLWSYNTTMRSTTGGNPFLLTYGCEAMVSVKVTAITFNIDHFDEEANLVNHKYHNYV